MRGKETSLQGEQGGGGKRERGKEKELENGRFIGIEE